jgi:homoserine kinase type II
MGNKFQIERVLKEYDLGRIESVNDQSHGYANRNYSVKCTSREIFVRFCDQQPVVNIEQEILLMSVLKENNFKTAYPIPRKDGGFLSFLNKVPVVVYEFLEGELPELNKDVVSQIAEAAGLLALIEPPDGLIKKNSISADDSRAIIRSEAFRKFTYPDVTENFVLHFNKLEYTLSQKLPKGIVHGDIFPDNTLFDNNKLAGLIDFEEFAIDNLLFDVGMAINGFCFNGVEMSIDFLRAFIRKYNSIRKLRDDEIKYLPQYICWGAVGMTSWHLHQLLSRRNREQLKRVRILLERARLTEINTSLIEDQISSLF